MSESSTRRYRLWAALRTIEGLIALASAAGSAVLVWIVCSTHGPGVDTDGVDYMFTAKTIGQGHWPLSFDGLASTKRPPGFPLVISVAHAVVPGSIVNSVVVINGLATAAIVLGAWVLLRAMGARPYYRMAGVIAVAASPWVLRMGMAALSEAVFTAIFVWWAAVVVRNRDRIDYRATAVIGLMAGAALLTRILGIAVVGSTVIWFLFRPGRFSLPSRLRHTVLAGALGGLPFALWILHNRIRTGTGIASYGGSAFTRWQWLHGTYDFDTLWVSPPQLSFAIRAAALAGLTLLVAILLARRWDVRFLPPIIAIGAYVAFITYANQHAEIGIVPRITSPLEPLFLALVLVAASVTWPYGIWSRVVPALAVAFAVILLLLSSSDIREHWRNGDNFTDQSWRTSALMQTVESGKYPVTFANEPAAVAFRTGDFTRYLPASPGAVNTFVHDLKGHPAYAAWFTNRRRVVLPGDKVEVKVVASTPDGKIVRITPR